MNFNEDEILATSFRRDLIETIEESNVSKRKVATRAFKPSSFNCCRCAQFILMGTPQDKDKVIYNVSRIADSGTAGHDILQNYIIDMRNYGHDWEYVSVESFVKERNLVDVEIRRQDGNETLCYNKKYNIIFKCDGILKHADKYYILEIKTESTTKHQGRLGADKVHRNQSVLYSLCLGLDTVIWLYEDRNICTNMVFVTHVTDEEIQEAIDRMQYVNDCIASGGYADKAKDKSACKYCAYKSSCSRVDVFF